MRIKNLCFLLTLLSLEITISSTSVLTQPSPDFLVFCSNVRDQYISNTKQKYQNQRYSGSGSAGAGIDFKQGFKLGGKGNYNWQRTWDEMESNQKSEYTNKNCDEALRQWGLVSIAEIQANAQEAIERIKLEGGKYSEDTKRIVADINLEVVKAETDAAQNIAKTQADADKYIAASNNSAQMHNVDIINNTKRDVARTEADAAQNIAKTQARANTNSAIIGNVGAIVGNSIISSNNRRQQKINAEIEKQKIEAELEKARLAAQIEREKLATSNIGISSLSSPVDQLLAQWQWTRIACFPGAVFIDGLSNETICISPTNNLSIGHYAYDRNSNQLIPMNATSLNYSKPVIYPIPSKPDYSSNINSEI